MQGGLQYLDLSACQLTEVSQPAIDAILSGNPRLPRINLLG